MKINPAWCNERKYIFLWKFIYDTLYIFQFWTQVIRNFHYRIRSTLRTWHVYPMNLFSRIQTILYARSYDARVHSVLIPRMIERSEFGRAVRYTTRIAPRTQQERCRAYSTAYLLCNIQEQCFAIHARPCGLFRARTIKPRFTGRKVNEGGHVCPFSVFQGV